ncbi:MAG TPA: hypothetical protein VGP82_22350 [Ktedonobacterales bacterium]|jgi:hypothetical protein|nr:hypothetical protein [Ktedonobacterales bacterium]
MKTATPHDNIPHAARRHHPIRNALGLILLSGAITAVIVAATVEVLGVVVAGTGPTTTTHIVAALLAIPIGYAVAITLAIGELARGMDAAFERMVAEVQGIRTHAAETANAQIAAERQRGVDQGFEEIPHATKRIVPTGMLSGLMEGVEQGEARDINALA